MAGQYFDIRLEVHQPVNGSEAIGLPLDEKFTFTVGKKGAAAKPVTEYFSLQEPKLEKWNFTWFEGMSTFISIITSTYISTRSLCSRCEEAYSG